MTRKRIPCTLSSRVIGPSSHSGSLGRVRTLGKIRPMAFFFVHGKCQHYYESGHSRASALTVGDTVVTGREPALVERLLARVVGEAERPAVLRRRLGPASETAEEIGTRGGQQ